MRCIASVVQAAMPILTSLYLLMTAETNLKPKRTFIRKKSADQAFYDTMFCIWILDLVVGDSGRRVIGRCHTVGCREVCGLPMTLLKFKSVKQTGHER